MKTWELHLGSVPKEQSEGGELHDHEPGVARPYLILRMFPSAKTLIACPLSTSAPDLGVFRIRLEPKDVEATGSNRPGYEIKHTVVMVDQIRTMAFKRFVVGQGTSCIGRLSPTQQAEVEVALNALLDLSQWTRKKK